MALGLGEKFEEIEDMYAAANDILGNLVKVTPSSKVVGDLALHLVATGVDPAEFAAQPGTFDIPESVIGFLAGELGDPPGGWREPFRTMALEGRVIKTVDETLTDRDKDGLATEPRTTLNRLLFPGPTADFEAARSEYGDISKIPTEAFWYGLRAETETEIELEPGKLLIFGLEAIGDADERGLRSVMGTINGQLRPTTVRDRSVNATIASAERADPGNADHIAIPFAGVVNPTVAEGDSIAAGQIVATIEAMKMEAAITVSRAGTVKRLVISKPSQAEGGDLLLELG
jgi:pyruvate carboxylase